MKKLVITTLLMLLCTVQGFAKVDQIVNISVKDDNGKTETRSYRLYVPDNVKENAPLVVSLHGANGNQWANRPMTMEVADTEGFIVVYPQGKTVNFYLANMNTTGWVSSGEVNADVEYIKAVIEDVKKKYSVDSKRIYCCGFSNGGMMTYALSNTCADIFAAFASISGFQMNEFHFRHTGARPVPFLHIHGKADDFVKYSLMPTIVDEMVARIGANPVPVKTTQAVYSYQKSGKADIYKTEKDPALVEQGYTQKATKYDVSVYEAAEGSFPYVYYEIDGMGHSDFTNITPDCNSAKTMWNFFKQYKLDDPCDATLKWMPRVEEEGYKPSQHGWMQNLASYILYYRGGKHDANNSNNNVYRSLQLDNGNYKLRFKSSGDAGKEFVVRIKKVDGGNYVLDTTAKVGEDATFLFKVEDGWGDYSFELRRNSTSDQISVTDVVLTTATDEEMASVQALNAVQNQATVYYTLGGVPMAQPQKGVNIVRTGSDAKTVYVK